MSYLRRITSRRYEQQKLLVDGHEFIGCEFIGCQLVFSATAPVSYHDCQFINCDWTFDDAADMTLNYLSMLYHQGGIEGRGLVDAAFANIRGQLQEESPASAAMPAMRP